ncbi:hypothetical protein M0813_01905 [Anaeramoeba flamelloides]|uniref:Uncharacterized protein n=1 Tax=Anaeramoeba flamelloides TaxID=1746091 RepID=A0ABQ8YQ88_9EUKA|nr:hypothetical protein M0813_01905 [Anaeramoeba flamelloides]
MSRVSDIWRPCHKASVIGQDCVDGLGAYTVGTILQSIILRTNYQEIPGSNDATSKKINKANTTRVKDLEKNTLSSGGSKSSKSSSSSEITPSSSINSTLISDQTGKTNIPKNGKQQVSVDII